MRDTWKNIIGWAAVILIGGIYIYVYNNYLKKEVKLEKVIERAIKEPCEVYDLEIESTEVFHKTKDRVYNCFFMIRTQSEYAYCKSSILYNKKDGSYFVVRVSRQEY